MKARGRERGFIGILIRYEEDARGHVTPNALRPCMSVGHVAIPQNGTTRVLCMSHGMMMTMDSADHIHVTMIMTRRFVDTCPPCMVVGIFEMQQQESPP